MSTNQKGPAANFCKGTWYKNIISTDNMSCNCKCLKKCFTNKLQNHFKNIHESTCIYLVKLSHLQRIICKPWHFQSKPEWINKNNFMVDSSLSVNVTRFTNINYLNHANLHLVGSKHKLSTIHVFQRLNNRVIVMDLVIFPSCIRPMHKE